MQKTENVMELINQFFTLAKLESGDMDIEISKTNINEICREGILDFHEILIKNNFQVEIDIPEYPIYVHGNNDDLLRILFNLISNANRYGTTGKYLGVFLRADEKFVYVDITDKGKGIDQPFADSVFECL